MLADACRNVFLAMTVALAIAASSRGETPADLELIWSDPPPDFVDVRQDRDALGQNDGIVMFELQFNQPVMLTKQDVELLSFNEPVEIESLEGEGAFWRVFSSQPIAAGTTTVLSIGRGRILLHVHSRPCDVNLDGVADSDDIAELQAGVALSNSPVNVFDIDRNGIVNDDDVDRLNLLLEGTEDQEGWAGYLFSELLSSECCCDHMACYVSQAGCSQEDVRTACPCDGNSCSSGSLPGE